jgi:hypothetical protein
MRKKAKASDSHGMVLRRDQFAIAANMDGSFSFHVPQFPEDVPVPRSVLLIAAVAARIDDEKWVGEMIGGMIDRLIDEAHAKGA